MARAETQPVRISADLLTALKKQAELAGRSAPNEVEVRLRESLGKGAWAETEAKLTPSAAAVGHFVGFLANELLEHSPAAKQAEYLQAGIARTMQRLTPNAKQLPDPKNDAETFADYWWLRLRNAAERTFEGGKPKPPSADQRALAEIWADIAPLLGAASKGEK